jgi:hypothetical protein
LLTPSQSTGWGPVTFASGQASKNSEIWLWGNTHTQDSNIVVIETASVFSSYTVDFFIFNTNSSTVPKSRMLNSLVITESRQMYSYGGVHDGGEFPYKYTLQNDLYKIDCSGLINFNQALYGIGVPQVPRQW